MAQEQNRVIIGFGANLGKPEEMYQWVRTKIAARLGQITAASKLYRSRSLAADGAIGTGPDYLNAVLLVETTLAPEAVLRVLQAIEEEAGRERTAGKRFAARTLDLDLLDYAGKVYQSSTLTLPHPEMHKRDFVLVPLAEACSDWTHPVLSQSATMLLDQLPLAARTCSSSLDTPKFLAQ